MRSQVYRPMLHRCDLALLTVLCLPGVKTAAQNFLQLVLLCRYLVPAQMHSLCEQSLCMQHARAGMDECTLCHTQQEMSLPGCCSTCGNLPQTKLATSRTIPVDCHCVSHHRRHIWEACQVVRHWQAPLNVNRPCKTPALVVSATVASTNCRYAAYL